MISNLRNNPSSSPGVKKVNLQNLTSYCINAIQWNNTTAFKTKFMVSVKENILAIHNVDDPDNLIYAVLS